MHSTLTVRSRPAWSSFALWLVAFVSPTVYFAGLLMMAKLEFPAPPFWFLVGMFFLLPVAAAWCCLRVAWQAPWERNWRIGWIVLTILGMLVQVAVQVLVILSAITVAISL
jgi:hypothetical protein